MYERDKAAIYRFLRAKLPTNPDAEDAMSSVFMRLWSLLTTSENVSAVRPILYTVAKNVIADFYRRRAETVSIEALENVGEEPEGKETPEKIMAGIDLSLVREKLNLLSELQRDVIILRCLDGLSTRETANRLGKTENAIYLNLHRGLRELRKLLNV